MDPNYQKQPLCTSMFYMWRSLLAIAWSDGRCGEEETAYFAKVFDNLARFFDMTQEQRDILADDLVIGKNVDKLFNYINDPEARSTLVIFAEDLIMLDGKLDPNEEDIIRKLKLWDEPGYDREQLRIDIQKLRGEQRDARAEEKKRLRFEIRSTNALFNAVDRLMLRLGIDLVD